MLYSKIIEIAETQCDEAYETQDWIDLINMCQDELTPLAKMLTTKEGIAVTVTTNKANITLASDTDLSLAHEILNTYYTPAAGSEIQLRRLPVSDRISKGWKMDSSKLYLQGLGTEATGTLSADYYKKLVHVTYTEGPPETFTPASPEIPEEYHYLYVLYLCAKSQQQEEELEDMAAFMGQFQKAKQDFQLDRVKQMEPWRVKEILRAQAQNGGGG